MVLTTNRGGNMSKNIIIQEGGVGKQLTADKLKTNLVGGGTCLWVPEDETQLGIKHISENGTYKASDDGYYGYSEVTVSGIGTATGKDPDGSGDDATATVDPETGEIVITKLPYSISVVTPPTVTEYNDGATIDFSGMVVKGYLKSGDLWTDSSHPNGIIPISELTLPVTTADSGSASGERASSELIPGGFEFGGSGTITAYKGAYEAGLKQIVSYTAEAVTLGWPNQYTTRGIAASSSPGSYSEHISYPDGTSKDDTGVLNRTYTYNGKTVYYIGPWGTGWGYSAYTVENVAPNATDAIENYDGANIAWTMIYGTITAGGQVIPVQYMSGEKTLESSFTITVNPGAPGYGTEE